MASWVAARDQEELEGALLPVATHIEENPNSANPAIPVARFDYDDAITAEAEQCANIAHPLDLNGRAATSDDSSPKVRRAGVKGRIEAIEEIDAIRNANRNVFSKNYFSNQEIRNANQVARVRNQQGLEIPARLVAPSQQIPSNDRKSEPSQNQQKPGYEIKEYKFGSDYKVQDYEVQKYKSLYE